MRKLVCSRLKDNGDRVELERVAWAGSTTPYWFGSVVRPDGRSRRVMPFKLFRDGVAWVNEQWRDEA